MLGDDEIKEMQEEINLLETQLRERKRELHNKRYAGLRSAMEARKDADQAITEELKALGIKTIKWNPLFP
jgi:hypothetical protein